MHRDLCVAGDSSIAGVAGDSSTAGVAGDLVAAGAEAEGGPHVASKDAGLKKRNKGVYMYLTPEPHKTETISTATGSRVKSYYYCNIPGCGRELSIDGNSTGNSIKHFKNKSSKCNRHREAYLRIQIDNPKMVLVRDELLPKFTFEESFEHHVRFVYLVADGVAANIRNRPSFKEYIQGFEPRVTMPAHSTIKKIAECITELQDECIIERLERRQAAFQNSPCLGLQLDMWTDSTTHVCYAAVLVCTVSSLVHAKVLTASIECLELEQFPFTSHTGANIKTWFLDLLARKKILDVCISGITPDGAADGQCAFWLMDPPLSEIVDTCLLHQLQRAVLYSIGLAGTGSGMLNIECKDLVVCHRRIVAASNQARHVSDGIHNAQIAAKIPHHKVLSTVTTNATRWGNQYNQINRNIVLRPVIDPVIAQYKAKNSSDRLDCAASIVETDDNGHSTEVRLSKVGMTPDQWEQSLQLESHLRQPYEVKESIEKNKSLTGAQSYILLKQLRDSCDRPLQTWSFPRSISISDRSRALGPSFAMEALCQPVQTARTVLKEELDSRVFGTDADSRPSESRLVALYMSKQLPPEKSLPPALLHTAKSLYVKWLIRAHGLKPSTATLESRSLPLVNIEQLLQAKKNATPTSPRKKLKRSMTPLFEPDSPELPDQPTSASAQAAAEDEALQWRMIPRATIKKHTNERHMVDEFALVSSLREQFPLHYIVFQQSASHLAAESETEDVFSLCKGVSDHNMHPSSLRAFAKITRNKHTCKPTPKEVWARYVAKFGKQVVEVEDASDSSASDTE